MIKVIRSTLKKGTKYSFDNGSQFFYFYKMNIIVKYNDNKINVNKENEKIYYDLPLYVVCGHHPLLF